MVAEKLIQNNKADYLYLLKLKIEKQRRERIRQAQANFWSFCQLMADDFYLDHRWHLKLLCKTLQDFYEQKLINKKTGLPYKKMIIEMPPRHGKSRTLILFCAWAIGKNNSFKIITSAYNDDLASDFSKFTRNTISEERNLEEQFIYNDIFKDTVLKKGDSALHQWALENQFFNFKSAGKGGGITGYGGNLLLIDDPIKGIADAFNEAQLNRDWEWYTGTWIQRMEPDALEIINHTPWAKQDISGRLQNSDKKDLFYVLSLPAFDGKEMLCPDILSREQFEYLKSTANELIFLANYMMQRVDVKGLLYGSDWKTYTELPKDAEGKELYTEFGMWCDTADKGEDFLCAIFGKIYQGYCYIVDVYYTQSPVEITEPELTDKIIYHKVNFGLFEENNGGHMIANHIYLQLKEKGWFGTPLDCFPQNANKKTRILSQQKNVKDRIIMPVNWMHRWPDFYKDVTTFLKEGKNIHDDAPDTLTQIVEYMTGDLGNHVFINN